MRSRENPVKRKSSDAPVFRFDEFDALKTSSSRQAYAAERLIFLGEGSDRAVFILNPRSVLKIAKGKRGRMQNEKEASISSDRNVNEIVAKVQRSADDDSYLVSELVYPVREEEIGFDLQEILDLMRNAESIDEVAAKYVDPSSYEEALEEAAFEETDPLDEFLKITEYRSNYEELRRNRFLNGLYNLIHTYDLSLPDLMEPSHYGKTRDGRIVLLDYGFHYSMKWADRE